MTPVRNLKSEGDQAEGESVQPVPQIEPSTRRPTGRHRHLLRAVALAGAVVLALAGWGVSAPVAGADGTFTFTGSGWGHGVGMSQWGARGLAAQGSSSSAILGHYYSGTAVTTTSTGGIRVILSTSSAFTVTPGLATTFSSVSPLGTTSSPVTVTSSGGTINLSGGVNASVAGLVSIGLGAGPGVRLSTTGYRYARGTIWLHPTGTGSVQAVLHTSMQEYLYGLGEMPSSWPAAALQAQAIAARTYAQKKVNGTAGTGTYDIVGGLPDQSYLGWEKEVGAMGNLWVAAVDATNTQVVTYGGSLIDAVYSASSGGHTENSEVVWVSALPYLRGVPDPADLTGGNPNAAWTRTFSGSQLGAWFGIGQVTSVQIIGSTGASGRVDKATIRLTGTSGSRDVIGSSFRSTVNASSPSAQLMSTRFTVNGVGSTPAPAAPPSSPPSAVFSVAKAEGTTIVVGGAATDADGPPRLRIVSTMGRDVAVRETQAAAGGLWATSWTGGKGTRNICVSALDTPTGQATPLGCRDVTVK